QTPTSGAGGPSAPDTAPSAATPDTGGQYQQNGGRYQPDNSTPISTEIGRSSSPKSASVPGRTSAPKSGPIPLPKCLQDLPDSVLQTACDDALSQLPDVRTVLGAPRSTHSSGRPQPRRGSKPSAASHPTLPAPAVPTHPQTDAAPHTAAVVAAAVPTAKRTAPAASRHETRVTVRSHDLRPVRTKPAPSLTALRPD